MKISIFGLGYVGSVSAACLSRAGHAVTGVDINEEKVRLVNAGRAPVVEGGLEKLIEEGVKRGRLRATLSSEEAVLASDVSLVCVGTPSRANGSLNLDFVARVCREIGEALKKKDGAHLVCIRSTVLPGTTDGVVLPSLAGGCGGRLPDGVEVAVNPEFLREGSAVHDFSHPPKTVVGARNGKTAEKVLAMYEGIEAPVFKTDVKTAEMIKYVDNMFHALKVSFANEVGNICKALGIDSHRVMDVFCRDKKLNISPAYLRPGFAFGGSCLPKDLRAMLYRARSEDLDLPLISSILPSNQRQIERAFGIIRGLGKKKLAFLGMSFKPGTDDLRESPVVELIEKCLGKGYQIRIFDRNVSLAKLTGANRAYIEKEIPHISALMVESIEEAVSFGKVVVVGHKEEDFSCALAARGEDKVIVDLVRLFTDPPGSAAYIGVNW